jgi:hypothetical protein
MDITPTTEILRSYRDAGRIDFVLLVAEAVDNALDAGATLIRVSLGKDEIRIVDNGVGVSRDRFQAMFQLGGTGLMTTTALGRFGVGIKLQALRCGDIYRVETVSGDGRMGAEINWRQILDSGRWRFDPPPWKAVAPGTATGTVVIIAELRPEAAKINLMRVRERIALLFQPALADGKVIVINGEELAAIPEPENLDDVIDCELSFARGRCGARLWAGISSEPIKKNRGVRIGYKHRIIIEGSAFGCGTYVGGLDRLVARVQLTGSWRLGQFKDDIPDGIQREELDAAILENLEPLLEKCQSTSLTAQEARLLEEINAMLPASLRPVRRKPWVPKPPGAESKKKVKRGFVSPDKAESGAGGPARPKNARKLVITYNGSAEKHGIGSFDATSRPWRVNLARDLPEIAAAARDPRQKRRQLLMALMIYVGSREANLFYGKEVARLLAANEEAQEDEE